MCVDIADGQYSNALVYESLAVFSKTQGSSVHFLLEVDLDKIYIIRKEVKKPTIALFPYMDSLYFYHWLLCD